MCDWKVNQRPCPGHDTSPLGDPAPAGGPSSEWEKASELLQLLLASSSQRSCPCISLLQFQFPKLCAWVSRNKLRTAPPLPPPWCPTPICNVLFLILLAQHLSYHSIRISELLNDNQLTLKCLALLWPFPLQLMESLLLWGGTISYRAFSEAVFSYWINRESIAAGWGIIHIHKYLTVILSQMKKVKFCLKFHFKEMEFNEYKFLIKIYASPWYSFHRHLRSTVLG